MEVHDPVSAILTQKDRQIWTIAPDATVYEALELMARKKIGALIVLGADGTVGLFSERDYARKVILKGRSSKEATVSEVMTSPAETIPPDTSVREAMSMMTESRVRHLPVISENRELLGMVSIGDLVKWIITSQEQVIEQLHSYIAGAS